MKTGQEGILESNERTVGTTTMRCLAGPKGARLRLPLPPNNLSPPSITPHKNTDLWSVSLVAFLSIESTHLPQVPNFADTSPECTVRNYMHTYVFFPHPPILSDTMHYSQLEWFTALTWTPPPLGSDIPFFSEFLSRAHVTTDKEAAVTPWAFYV